VIDMEDSSSPSMAVQFVKPPRERRWYWRILRFPLVRILIWVPLIFIAGQLPFGIVLGFFGSTRGTATGPQLLLALCIALIGAFLGYWLLARFIEWRPMSDLTLRGAGTELALGVGLGVGLLSIVMGIIALTGGYHITAVNAPGVMLAPFAFGVLAGVVEEIVFRGVLFRIVEESLGTWVSTLISALIFGLLHAGNPNASMISCLSIAIFAGPLMAWAYIATRRLWICFGIHFAWNFALGGVFGAPVSGNAASGLFASELSGPEWISGGAFGPEASIVAVALGLGLSIVLYVVAAKRGHVVKPFWRRPRDSAPPGPGAPPTS